MIVALCLTVHVSWVKLSVVALSFSVLYEYWSITHFCHLFGIVSPHLCHNGGWTSVRVHILWDILLITYSEYALLLLPNLATMLHCPKNLLDKLGTQFPFSSCMFYLIKKTDWFYFLKMFLNRRRINDARRNMNRINRVIRMGIPFYFCTIKNLRALMSIFAQRVSGLIEKHLLSCESTNVSICIVLRYFGLEANGTLKL